MIEDQPQIPLTRTSRYWLRIKAVILRILMRIGMLLHGYPFPRPPRPSFTRELRPSSTRSSSVKLLFYTPKDYDKNGNGNRSKQSPSRDTANVTPSRKKYPVVVNFHGGGFCIGRASDDARWSRIVVESADAVVVSVDYRLAPEHPFPAAVDDGVDALLYLEAHADELSLDASRIAITGFSAGGNLAFSVPLRLRALTRLNSNSSSTTQSTTNLSSALASSPSLKHYESTDLLLNAKSNRSDSNNSNSNSIQIVAICSWYPILDFVVPRHIRRDRSIFPQKTLSPFFTNLFDNAYVPDPDERSSPYASPGLASSEALIDALPTNIFMYMCEWDMLLREGQEFVQRLEQGGKKVWSVMVEQSTHAWDKSVNPFRDQDKIDVLYRAACEELKKSFA